MRENWYRGNPKNKADYQLFSQTWKENCIDGFVYGSLIVSKDRYYICVSALCMANSLVNNGITTMIEVIPETVGQYTGLTDKNGKKIFEGDILKCSDGTFCVVEWDEQNARFLGFTIGENRFISYVGREPASEIIGNIYENPELLKGGTDNGHP